MTAPQLPFDATGGTQQPAATHDPTAPFGEAGLTTTGKLVVGALLGGAVWYLYEFGWPWAKPAKGRKVR